MAIYNIERDPLKKICINAGDIQKHMKVGRDKSYYLIKVIRKQNQTFYKSKIDIYGKHNVSPLHLVLYLGWTREEYFLYIK